MQMALLNFLRFSRLHTIVGTSLSVSALYLIAASHAHQWDALLWLYALLACLAANIYIVGLNQVTDVEIDRINKPYLPLASGAYSMQTGMRIILIALFISLIVALHQGRFLALCVLLSLFLGTAYSLPPIRLKRFHIWAALCIIAVRGIIVNLFLFVHFYEHLGGRQYIAPEVLLLTSIIFTFGIVIAWFKDIPDAAGDEQFKIRTLALRLGAKQVWLIGSIVLTLGLLGIVIAAVFTRMHSNNSIIALGNLGIFLAFWWLNGRLDLKNAASIARFYQSVWILFFLEYITFALAGLLG